MTGKKTMAALILLITGFAVACTRESLNGDNGITNQPGNTCEGINAQFAADVFPIIQTKCATGSGCHGAGSNNGPGALTGFTQVKNAAARIKNAVTSGRMPLNGSLTQTQIRQISCWVDSGTPEN
jgi:hypothetical protein